jgi:hypothetical protein
LLVISAALRKKWEEGDTQVAGQDLGIDVKESTLHSIW